MIQAYSAFCRRQRWLVLLLAGALLPALTLTSCESMSVGENTALGGAIGAVGGAALGAAIGGDDNRVEGALIGAAAGAALGAAAGYYIGKTYERQLASKEELEREYYERRREMDTAPPQAEVAPPPATEAPELPEEALEPPEIDEPEMADVPVLSEPVIEIEGMTVNPNYATGGSDVVISATYLAYGPREEPPVGRLTLLKNGEVLAEAPLRVEHLGKVAIEKTLSLPKEAAAGEYEVMITMEHGPTRSIEAARFYVA